MQFLPNVFVSVNVCVWTFVDIVKSYQDFISYVCVNNLITFFTCVNGRNAMKILNQKSKMKETKREKEYACDHAAPLVHQERHQKEINGKDTTVNWLTDRMNRTIC